MKVIIGCILLSGFFLQVRAQVLLPLPASWKATLTREDGHLVVFNLHSAKADSGSGTVLFISNGEEKISITDVSIKGDSIHFNMPSFESSFSARILSNKDLRGTWTKGTARNTQYWPFHAFYGQDRFKEEQGNARTNITGRWAVQFTRRDSSSRVAVANFIQKGNYITGTVLTPSSDYRYLEGVVTGDSLKLSTFDGAHAYLLTAKIVDSTHISGGFFYAGINGKEGWTAVKDATAMVPDINTPELKEGQDRFHFSFKDIDGKTVSIHDDRFKNKVVIIQIMGSWCPNCLDETKYLSGYYRDNKNRGIEIISLAYEYSTDFERSQKSLRKFQKLFNVEYPMLITGVGVSDSLRTEKTLPQITPIKAFPTLIFVGKDGTVKKLSTGYFGPAAGKDYILFTENFENTVDTLLREK